jgi:RND family efflux transporter MFP subunit
MSRFVAPAAGALALAVAALLFSACAKSGDETAKASPPPTVAVAKAAREDLSRDLVMTAELKPFQEIEVMAKVSGYVKAIHVDIGDRVAKGELIAMLEVPEMADDLARGKAALKRSEAEAARARDELKHAQSLHDIANLSYTRLAEVAARRSGLVAQQEIDDAKSKALATEAQVDAARSGLEAANQQIDVSRGALGRVKTMLNYARVTAPFAGIVTKRFADVGSMIQAGTASQTQAMPLVRLSDSGLLRLILPVPESAVPTIHIGQRVEVRIPSLKRSVSGSVTRFANTVSVGTRTMDTEVDVQNPGLAIVPGMFAEVRLVLDQHKGALAVPVSSVDQGEGEPAAGQPKDADSQQERVGRVLVVTPANSIEIRRVSLGLETAAKVEVLTGLKEGDLVVIGGRSSLQAGQKVQPKLTTMGGAPSHSH